MRARSARLGLIAVCSVLAAVAQAAVQRTFVHSAPVGDDANTAFNCSLSKPCRSFSAALGLTLAGGEIVVLDSAGYGPVTITQAVTIVAPAGVYAGITVPASGTGVKVQAGATDTVTLRGITIKCVGGDFGIEYLSGRTLVVDRADIGGCSIGIQQTSGGNLSLRDSSIADGGAGVDVKGSPGKNPEFTIERTHFRNESTVGVNVWSGLGYVRHSSVSHTCFSCSFSRGIYALGDTYGNPITNVTLDAVMLSDNKIGAEVDSGPGAAATIRVTRSVATRNDKGFSIRSGASGTTEFRSLNNSLDDGNTNPSSPRTTLTPY